MQRPMPPITPLNRYEQLFQQYGAIDIEKRPMTKNPEAIQAYQTIQKLKQPGAAPILEQNKIIKQKLPTPPVDLKQAWANNCLDRFADRFLISINDFDENGRFYVQNEITVQLEGNQAKQRLQKTTYKEEKLQKLAQKRIGMTRSRMQSQIEPPREEQRSMISQYLQSGLDIDDKADFQEIEGDDFIQMQLGKVWK
ncbi:Hypothetical_protein [Hexamita inflata]|uniref:Hypothetical_protein n=1 Tax=Hexamita inflata TaxID=28002 RepID=A0AA86PRB7_9EUKA|nr:Hypothetical protein HINF_LOCUS30926 [Hexamita inflata]